MIARKQLSRLHEIEATSVAREMIKRSQVLENILGKSEKGVERIVRMILERIPAVETMVLDYLNQNSGYKS